MTAAEHMTDRKERMAAANQRASEELHINETPTDSGNAYRFARLFKDKVKYVPEKNHGLFGMENSGSMMSLIKHWT